MLKLAPFVGNFSNKTCELSASYCFTFSSPEAAILLVSTENHNLWPAPTPEVRDSRTSRYSAHALSQVWQIWLVLVSMYCVYKAIRNQNVVGPGQRSWFSVLTKRIAASGDENDCFSVCRLMLMLMSKCEPALSLKVIPLCCIAHPYCADRAEKRLRMRH